ncbi:YciI family protein [Microlunatus sp. Gsoil 973]|jgi:uncharacterized protein YciI|uniref:YciI family protein n=1 Tax=Microlunatus sp. Gsoil 973 TaxID=2672569 RepID=UPI0012B48EE2|nr:YciI family protein [Microlunatus sp. Gsoil 973]QGN31546.1 hypothetical protein GJV80_00440 [Microlunatus sp. Gsoil 973]
MIVVELSYTTPSPERDRLRPAHRERLNTLREQGKILASGPWPDDTGALVIFTTGVDEARQLIAEDPYFRADGVEVVSAREWNMAVGPRD